MAIIKYETHLSIYQEKTMTIGITINGKAQIVPGVYSTLTYENSLTNPLPGPRNILIIGEATSGVPGNQLNLAGAYFSNFSDVQDYYGSGPLVDAAHMIFTQQTSPAFTGSVNRLYCYKTNQSTQASRTLLQTVGSTPTIYGNINAAAQGTDGNLISAQVLAGNPVTYPNVSGYWLMDSSAISLGVSVNGVKLGAVNILDVDLPSNVVSKINGLNTGTPTVLASGGGLYDIMDRSQLATTASDINSQSGLATNTGSSWSIRLGVAVNSTPGQIVISAYSSTDGATYTASQFLGAGMSSVIPGDIVYIPPASSIAGAGGVNGGCCYIVISASSSGIVANKISGGAALPVAVAQSGSTAPSGAQGAVATAEFLVYRPISISSILSSVTGSSNSMEIYESTSGLSVMAQRLISPSSFVSPVSSTIAIGGSVSLSVTNTTISTGQFTITNGSWQNIPSAGSVLWIGRNSMLAGATLQNVGAWVVTSSGSSVITAVKASSAVLGTSVAAVSLAGTMNPFDIQPAIASSIYAGNLLIPSYEATVYLSASRQSDGASFPTTQVGGRVVLEVGYAGTSATLSIDSNYRLSTTVVGGSGASISSLNLGAYSTIGDLIKFLNSQTGYSARVSNNKYLSLSPKCLDQVTSMGICSGVTSVKSYPGRVKADYYDFSALFTANTGLLSFSGSDTLLRKAGLPSVDSVASFLAGGTLGATGNLHIAQAYDAALKVEVSQVVPLFSRDASYDISDGLTDALSTYSISAIISSLASHVSTASNSDYRKERYGLASYHGTFAATQQLSSSLGATNVNMFFQMVNAVGADGNLAWFLPWMGSCMVAAGRAQAALGVSMLRKSFACTAIKHPGNVSIYSSSLSNDFDPDLKSDQELAIQAGLIFLRSVSGAGQRMESPDASTYVSLSNDPKEWALSRINVQFCTTEVIKTARATIDNFIGETTIDVSAAVLRKAVSDVLAGFVSQKALKGYQVQGITSLGNGYKIAVRILPVEAVEFIELDFTAGRDVGQ